MNVVPRLVLDTETGKVCIQVVIGSHSATLELPDQLATATRDEIQLYMERVVPDMIVGLQERRREEMKDIRRRLKREEQ